jgi:hypothetical protein
MSRLFGRHLSVRLAARHDPAAAAAGASLLAPPPPHGGSCTSGCECESSPQYQQQSPTALRSWSVARRPSERRPMRKLVKEPSGSARPSFSVELSSTYTGDEERADNNNNNKKKDGGVRRRMERLIGIHREGK